MLRTLLVSIFVTLFGCRLALAQDNRFDVLAYHDVRDTVADDFDADQHAISTANLIDHFTWLRLNDFNVVSVDDILAARRGETELPDRAVLLTFDDGFRSVATHVLPLLELFDYPAIVSIVTDWIETDPGVRNAGRELTRDDFLTWNQIAELADHELIEIASHSHAMHAGIVGNPQTNEQPAAVTALYDGNAYESLDDYRDRIRADLAQSVELIAQATGTRPRVVTWPFGAYNAFTLEAAADNGLIMSLTLSDGINRADDVRAVSRHLITANPNVEALGWALLRPAAPRIVRAAQVDLDYVYDADPEQQERNLGRLLDRIQAMEITHVFLQAFADPDADGGAQALYFPNDFLPVRADLFNRTAWQLKTRAGVLVYAWMPILSFEGEGIDPDWRVRQMIDGELVADAAAEPRLSPFSVEARAMINGIYADLARFAQFDGIHFHDDGRFNEFEDWSAAAEAAYQARFGADFSFAALQDSALKAEWAKFRSDALIDLTNELRDTVRQFQPDIRTSRNLFATALLSPEPELRLAQSYPDFLSAYDYTTIMAMPRFEGYQDHSVFYRRLATLAGVAPGVVGPAPAGATPAGAALPPASVAGANRDRVVFQLQTIDWRTNSPIDATEIRDTMRALQALGVRNLAYYPDDFIEGHPALTPIRQGMSIASFPERVAR